MMFWKKKTKRRIIDSSKCDHCIHYKTVHCPNSAKCFSHPDKPYFKPAKKEASTKGVPKRVAPPPKSKPDISHKKKPEPPLQRQYPEKEFLKIFKQLTYRHRAWEVWKDFIIMFACTLSNPVDKRYYDEREKLYLRLIKKYNKQEQLLFPKLVAETVMALELNPKQDFLGDIFMSLNLGDNAKAQIFTPYHVCEFMAAVTLQDVHSEVEEKGYITINDPCCGAGATLIAAAHEAKKQLEKVGLNFQNHILIVAQDIDSTVALMCYIQLSLLGVAGYVKIGNSLTEPIVYGDSLENYWFTTMYFSDVWSTRRLIKRMSSLFDEKEKQ